MVIGGKFYETTKCFTIVGFWVRAPEEELLKVKKNLLESY